jgi:hypothetical protein
MPHYKLTEDEFDAKFKPETNPDGSMYVQRDWGTPELDKVLADADARRCLWTMVEGDNGVPCIDQGYRYVNRIYYIITTVPYDEGDTFEIEPELPDMCSDCGKWFDTMDDNAVERSEDPFLCVDCNPDDEDDD